MIDGARSGHASTNESSVPEGAEQRDDRDETWWRSIIEHSSDLILVLDRSALVTYASPAASRLLGVAAADLVGRRLTDLVDPVEVSRAVHIESALHVGSNIVPGRYLIRPPEGPPRMIEMRASVQIVGGACVGWVVNGRDVTEAVEVERALRRSQRRFRAVVKHATDMIVMLDAQGRVRYVSPSVGRLLGYGDDDRFPHVFGLVHPDDREVVLRDFRSRVDRDDGPERTTFRIAHRDGSWRHCEAVAANRLDDPDLEAILVTLRDVTERVVAEAALAASEEHHRRVVERSPEATAVQCDGRLVLVNPAGQRLLGADGAGDVVGRSVFDFVHPDSLDRVRSGFELVLDEGVEAPIVEERLIDMRGGVVEVEMVVVPMSWDGAPAVQLVVRDVSERNRGRAALVHLATHDALTGLPNRALLLDRLSQAIVRTTRTGTPVGVLFVDLDRFKVMNDALGHEAGDEILCEVASRLIGAVRPSDTVARIGGDEFVVVLGDLDAGDDCSDVVSRIESALDRPVVRVDHTLYVSASIGVVLGDATSSASALLRDADSAMYLAKDAGRARSVWFTADLRHRVADRLRLESELRHALDDGELEVCYQTVVQMSDGAAMGAEALVRWAHPERGVLAPDRFISVAEETGLIVRLGRLVLDHACAEAARWAPDRAAGDRWVGVNVSAEELAQPDFIEAVTETIERHRLPPGRLCLEMNESVLMWDPSRAAEALAVLRDKGVTIAIDDFGTGYSSLNYLKRFPVDFVKIDREFVSGLGADRGDAAIVRAVIDMSHALGLEVIGEGVETSRQRDQLLALGCDYAQGWLYGQPVAGDGLRGQWRAAAEELPAT